MRHQNWKTEDFDQKAALDNIQSENKKGGINGTIDPTWSGELPWEKLKGDVEFDECFTSP